MKKILLCAALMLSLTACVDQVPPVSAEPAGNGYVVETLLTHDGCTLYTVHGSDVYWAKCAPGETVTTTSSYRQGKSTYTRHVTTENP